MIRPNSFNSLGIATVAASLVLRLEPQEVEMLVASARQVLTGWHVAVLGLTGAIAVRARRRAASTRMDSEFAEARILPLRSKSYLAAVHD